MEEYKDIDLEKQHLYFLRILGRKVGVKSPTSLKKQDLIKEIKNNINNDGRKEIHSLRGRPCLAEIEISKLADEKMKIMEKIKKEKMFFEFENYKNNIMKETALLLKKIEDIIKDF